MKLSEYIFQFIIRPWTVKKKKKELWTFILLKTFSSARIKESSPVLFFLRVGFISFVFFVCVFKVLFHHRSIGVDASLFCCLQKCWTKLFFHIFFLWFLEIFMYRNFVVFFLSSFFSLWFVLWYFISVVSVALLFLFLPVFVVYICSCSSFLVYWSSPTTVLSRFDYCCRIHKSFYYQRCFQVCFMSFGSFF